MHILRPAVKCSLAGLGLRLRHNELHVQKYAIDLLFSVVLGCYLLTPLYCERYKLPSPYTFFFMCSIC